MYNQNAPNILFYMIAKDYTGLFVGEIKYSLSPKACELTLDAEDLKLMASANIPFVSRRM